MNEAMTLIVALLIVAALVLFGALAGALARRAAKQGNANSGAAHDEGVLLI